MARAQARVQTRSRISPEPVYIMPYASRNALTSQAYSAVVSPTTCFNIGIRTERTSRSM